MPPLYWPIFYQALLAAVLCSALACAAFLFSASTGQDAEKRSEYECGFEPFDSATRLPFDVHFYLVGILFLIFDVEVALLYPYVVEARISGWFGFYLVIWFVVILGLGFYYEWRRGALVWPNRQHVSRGGAWVISAAVSDTSSILPDIPFSFSALSVLSVVVCIGVILLLGIAAAGRSVVFTGAVMGLTVGGVLALLALPAARSVTLLDGYILVSRYATVFQVLILLAVALVVQSAATNTVRAEIPVLIVMSTFFILCAVVSQHLLAAFFVLLASALIFMFFYLLARRPPPRRESPE